MRALGEIRYHADGGRKCESLTVSWIDKKAKVRLGPPDWHPRWCHVTKPAATAFRFTASSLTADVRGFGTGGR